MVYVTMNTDEILTVRWWPSEIDELVLLKTYTSTPTVSILHSMDEKSLGAMIIDISTSR